MTLLQQLVVWCAPFVVPQLPIFVAGYHGQVEVAPSDTRLAPYVAAMAVSNRTQLGFSDLPTDGQITIESAREGEYDVMLHSDGQISRSIAFRKTPEGYEWIYEQEIHQGPRKFVSDETETNEFIVIEYQTQPVNGIPPHVLYIRYFGPEYRLARRDDLTLKEIKRMLDEWHSGKSQ